MTSIYIGRSYVLAFIACANLLWAATGLAGVQFSLRGSQSNSNAGLQEVKSSSGSAGVSFDLGSYVRLGYTFSAQTQSAKGWVEDEDTSNYYIYDSRSIMTSSGIDLTLILYAGEVFTPYILAGGAMKSYDIETYQENKGRKKNVGKIPSPTGGAGLSIRIGKQFSLTLSQHYSVGIKEVPGQESESAIDVSSQVGIQYSP